jgi:hypothetical protein
MEWIDDVVFILFETSSFFLFVSVFFLSVYLLGSSALALLAWVSKVCSRKFGEEQENISRDGKPCQQAPVQLRSVGFSLGSASRG